MDMDGSDDLGWNTVGGVKGNLRNSVAPIMRTKIREDDGTPSYKFEFRMDDQASVVKFLNVLKDKFGIMCFDLKKEFAPSQEQIDKIANNTVDDWRERTKGLREDKDFSKKMKAAFSN